jgi:hypothetical protein
MMEAALAAQGKECIAPKGSLRHAARQLLIRASEETAILYLDACTLLHCNY